MSRIRTIKPEFPQSETIGRLSRDARLLFIMLWTIVDDEGRSRASSRMLASLLFPYDDDVRDNIDAWLIELQEQGCIEIYDVDGSAYLQIDNWLKHQKIDRPSKSRLPGPREDSSNTRRALDADLGPRTLDQYLGPKCSEVSNETSTHSSPDKPVDAPQELKLVDLQKARRERTESDLDLLDGITDLWNAWARQHGSPSVERLTEKRAIHCRRRITDLKAYGHDSPHEAFGFLLSKCSQSFYARGSPRKPLEFDQLMREDFMTRMLEGAFEHREAKRF